MTRTPLPERAVTVFRDRPLPDPAWPAGYARLIEEYGLRVPLPARLTGISIHYRKSETETWQLLGSRSDIPDTLGDHLTLALKWEGVDLGVLHALFRTVDRSELSEFVVRQPKSSYGRRVWFLFEWLTRERLPIDDLGKAKAVAAIDPEVQFALRDGELSSRHKVIDNLPGSRAFCPLVRRSDRLRSFDWVELQREARAVLGRAHPDVVRRAGDFLLVADSRASFRIEGEEPSGDRLQRWGLAIREAGATRLSADEFVRLQRLVVGDERFVRIGLRTEGGFVGTHDRRTRTPIPNHIDARPEDVPELVDGVATYVVRGLEGGVDPIVLAAAAAFGFVYVHPFEDGNGRLHRWLIHHVLAAGGLVPKEIVFPVSSVILDRIAEYRDVLESYSRPLLPLIDWEETDDHNVRVLNETASYYRYFDATRHAEFLYACIEETIRTDLPEEVAYLEAFDAFEVAVQRVVDLPERTLNLLVKFLDQNGGTLSRRARSGEFSTLHEDDVKEIEAEYARTLGAGGLGARPSPPPAPPATTVY
jgi:hypothetical protein